ncbi:hypothetical protein PV325_000392 [Microctonus aethiopoides]|uniref:O-acyltransferase n=1 Tax=Microctonus aethiopoides TaxID=144406 RepID=A0AA39KLI3_9HYME|nr:hypothetical protein PV325_000392 [Microctonus aethiopoides]KAK0165923.1 hypothetical protein PV328_004399 [Microctonus aethiopoides]
MDSKEINDGLHQRIKQEKTIEVNKVNEDKHQPLSNEKIKTTMSVEEVREQMQKLREDTINQVDEHLQDMVSKIVEGIQCIETNKYEKYYNDKKKVVEGDVLSEKEFQVRNSMLTDLCNEVNHLRALSNICVTVLFILTVNTAVDDYATTGSLQLGFTTLKLGFNKFSYVVSMWLKMMMFSIGVYIAYTVWAQKRMKLSPKSNKIKIWDNSWLFLFIIYQIAFLIVPSKFIMENNLPPPSACVILMEQLRILMKIHAFVRSTVPSIISYKSHTENNKSPIPGFSNFLYFMFAPTIVYRDNYPRTKEIRWRFVAWHFFQFSMVLHVMTSMFERWVIPTYKNYGLEPFNLQKFILRYFNTVLPGSIIFICGFYGLLHTWMNACAELLRFGDRLFYKDWWNSVTYARYYRTWNVVVHDWLYFYIYKDFYENIVPRNKLVAICSVFFISAIFHEYIIGFSLRLFCPIMLLTFGGLGFGLVFLTRRNTSIFGNIFLWFSLITGSGFLICLYSMEYFARINCPKRYDNIYDLIIPRFLLCYEDDMR